MVKDQQDGTNLRSRNDVEGIMVGIFPPKMVSYGDKVTGVKDSVGFVRLDVPAYYSRSPEKGL